MKRPGMPRLRPLDLATLVLAALALASRLYRIEFQSLWWDEGISLYLAGLDLPSLTSAKDFAVDLHPPLYHVLLGGWTSLAGTSVFAARYLSTALGVLTIPLTYYVGRRVSGRAAGLVAALLVAISPFQVFYAQEVRMYTLVPAIGLLSTVLCLRLLAGRKARWWEWSALVAVNALALYSYYYLGLLLLAENLAFLVVWLLRAREDGLDRAHWRLALVWVGAQAATAVLYVPWALALRGLFASGQAFAIPPDQMVRYGVVGYARECLLAFSVGFNRLSPYSEIAGAVVVLLALVGLLAPKRSEARWLLALGVAVPLALAFLIDLRRPFFYPRFVNYAAPLLFVLVGSGLGVILTRTRSPKRSPIALLAVLARVVALAGLAILLAANVYSLRGHYSQPRTAFSSSDYRAVLADLAERARPGDVVVGTYAWQLGYTAGYLPLARLDLRLPSAQSDPAAEAKRLLAGSSRLWLLLYSTDGFHTADRLESALQAAAPTTFVDQVGDSRVRLFAAGPGPLEQPIARLGDRIALLAAAVTPSGERHPGESVDLALTWQATAQVAESYTVFTHLLGPDGKVYGQNDSPPLGGASPTSTWRQGETVVDRYGLILAPDAPAGDYLVEAGMYLPSNGQRLPVGRSADEVDRVIVGRFKVVR